MATPVINQLPTPPTRSDGAADFSTKADSFVAALPQLVVQINATSVWTAQQVAAVDGYRVAAAGSATAAAQSATDANAAKLSAQQAVTDAAATGAAQVNLAAAQVALANQARDSAQTAAAAAGAAAGIPALTAPGNVLTITPDGGGVAFSSNLPAMHAAALSF